MSHTCEKCGSHVTTDILTNNALVDCAKVLANHTDINSTIENLLEVLCEFCEAEYSFIYERDYSTDKNELSHVYLSEKSTADFMTFRSVPFDAKNNFSKALGEQDYIFLTNKQADNPDFVACQEHLSSSPDSNMLIIPLLVKGDVVGVVGVINVKQHSSDFRVSISVAHFIASALNIKYSFDKLKQNDIKLEEAMSLNDALAKSIDTLSIPKYEDAIDTLLDLVCTYFNADRAYSFELDKENKTFINNFERVNGADHSCVTNLDDVPFDIAYDWVTTLKENDIFYKKIYDMDTSNEEYKFLLSENIIDLALVPLSYNGVLIGALGMDNPKRSGHNYELLKGIANLITNNIKRK